MGYNGVGYLLDGSCFFCFDLDGDGVRYRYFY